MLDSKKIMLVVYSLMKPKMNLLQILNIDHKINVLSQMENFLYLFYETNCI